MRLQRRLLLGANTVLQTTRQFAALVEKAVRTREPGQYPARATAYGFHVNRELEESSLTLPQAAARLGTEGVWWSLASP